MLRRTQTCLLILMLAATTVPGVAAETIPDTCDDPIPSQIEMSPQTRLEPPCMDPDVELPSELFGSVTSSKWSTSNLGCEGTAIVSTETSEKRSQWWLGIFTSQSTETKTVTRSDYSFTCSAELVVTVTGSGGFMRTVGFATQEMTSTQSSATGATDFSLWNDNAEASCSYDGIDQRDCQATEKFPIEPYKESGTTTTLPMAYEFCPEDGQGIVAYNRAAYPDAGLTESRTFIEAQDLKCKLTSIDWKFIGEVVPQAALDVEAPALL